MVGKKHRYWGLIVPLAHLCRDFSVSGELRLRIPSWINQDCMVNVTLGVLLPYTGRGLPFPTPKKNTWQLKTSHEWRCIFYWNSGFSHLAMLLFRDEILPSYTEIIVSYEKDHAMSRFCCRCSHGEEKLWPQKLVGLVLYFLLAIGNFAYCNDSPPESEDLFFCFKNLPRYSCDS